MASVVGMHLRVETCWSQAKDRNTVSNATAESTGLQSSLRACLWLALKLGSLMLVC